MTPLVSSSVFLDVELPKAPSTAWVSHIPFALWIVEQVQPRVFVELGTHYGHSYFSFCQSVLANSLSTKCYAVDTWEGDEHAGRGEAYGDDVFSQVDAQNRRLYSEFSQLMKMHFDEAVSYFSDGAIDLLHIDGLHSYEAARHDFETWRAKLSSRGIVLFHDICVRERGFGVWRLWEELFARFPSIDFDHSYGLGVLFIGKEQPPVVSELLADWAIPSRRTLIKQYFAKLGQGVFLSTQIAERDRLLATIDTLREAAAARDQALATRDQALAARDQVLAMRDQALATRDQHIKDIYASRSWRLLAPLRFIRRLLG